MAMSMLCRSKRWFRVLFKWRKNNKTDKICQIKEKKNSCEFNKSPVAQRRKVKLQSNKRGQRKKKNIKIGLAKPQ